MFPNVGIVLLELKKCFGDIRRWLIKERHIKRRNVSGGEIMKVLSTTKLDFIKINGFKGVPRNDWNGLSGASSRSNGTLN